MSVRGWVQSCSLQPQGSELVADTAAGATVLVVDDPTDYDDAGGTVDLNGERLDFLTVDEDGQIFLDSPTVTAALSGDRVALVSGGQVVTDLMLSVTCGDGDPAEVELSHEQRPLWPEGDYADPVEVLLSDDLETLARVPGRRPFIDSAYLQIPNSLNVLTANMDLATATWTTITGTFAFDTPDVTSDGFSGQVKPPRGMYGYVCTATFASNATGGRGIRSRFHFADGFSEIDAQAKGLPVNGDSSMQVSNYRYFDGTTTISFEAFQASGGTLALVGDSGVFGYRPTQWTLVRVSP